MAKGKAKVNYVDQTGDVTHSATPTWDFIYQTSLVKDPDHNIGDRVVLPDGREYRYGRSVGSISTIEACAFAASGVIPWTSAVESVAVGETEVTIPASSHAAAIEKDELRGGYIHINGSITDSADSMFRGIIGNDYSAIDAAITIYLDGPTDVAIDSSSAYEAFENPYANLQWDTGNLYAKAGVAAAYVSAALTYFWVQMKGPRWCNAQRLNGKEGLGGMFRNDGAIDSVDYTLDGSGTIPVSNTTQYAGHRIMGSNSGNGPLFMLQG